jgi:peptidoglycan hydrolase CwlO-like protein
MYKKIKIMKISQSITLSGVVVTARVQRAVSLVVVIIFLCSAVMLSFGQPIVNADEYDDKINALRAQNDSSQAVVDDLSIQANSYKDVIAKLQSQIDGLQASISTNMALQADLQRQITELQAELARQRVILSADIKAMYVDPMPSSIEMMAGSKNLSEFVDKQEYRSRVQAKIQETLTKIAALEEQVQGQKAKVEQLLAEQRTQQAQLDADRAKQQEMLAYNESQQASYTDRIRANLVELQKIQAAQRAALASVGRSSSGIVPSTTGMGVKYKNYTGGMYCGGGYRYCWANFDQYLPETLNKWGLEWARECVHYAADRLERDGKYVPNMGGSGNANQWYLHGQTVSSPRRGDVVYMPLPGVGHVGIVEWVNDDNTVHVSQMNWPYGGYYSEMDLYITSGVQFLRF